MKKAIIPFLLLIAANHYVQGTELKDVIQNEFVRIQKVAAIDNIKVGKLIFSVSSDSHAGNDNFDIIINESEIAQYTKDSGTAFTALYCRFILAHELAHQIQYGGYRKEVISRRRGEGTVFLECHADILAGLLITQIYNSVIIPGLMEENPQFDAAGYAKKMGPVTFSIYKGIFEMDKENTAIRTHPNNAERLLSIRQGIILGNVIFYHFQLTAPQQSGASIPASARDQIQFLYDHFSKGIGFDPFANPFMWAHDEAIRITHENNILAKNIVLFNENIEWSTNAQNPVVNFSFDVINRNQRTISFAGRVYTEIIPRRDRTNLITIAPVDGYVFTKTIRAGETATITGSMKWIADKDYMPNIIIPGDTRSVYWVFDPDHLIIDSTDIKSLTLQSPDWANGSLEDIKDLIYTITPHDHEFLSFARGMGYSDAVNASEVNNGKIYYEPSFKESGKKDQKIYIDQKSSRAGYQCTLFNSSDITAVNRHFSEIKNLIASSFHQYAMSTLNSGDKYAMAEFTENSRRAIRLRIKHDAIDKTYSVLMEIFGE